MLQYDLIKKRGYVIPNCPVFEISNVATFCEAAREWDGWGEAELNKISDALPPFDSFFMEYDFAHLYTDAPGSLRPKTGLLWLTAKDSNGWGCQIARYFSDESSPSGPLVQMLSDKESDRPNMLKQYVRGTEPNYYASFRISNTGTFHESDIKSDMSCKSVSQTLLPCLQAMMFLSMHSKSVRTVDMLPSRQVRRHAERSGEEPPTVFKVLQIGGMSRGGEPTGAGSSQPFHICRGHRRKYTAERPLFGKFVGTFWIEHHTKGSKQVGVVDKVYEMALV